MREITEHVANSNQHSGDVAHKLQQEIYVLSAGTIGGAAKEFSKHPVKTVADTVCMGATAVGLTAIATAELPVVSIVAAGTGAVYGARYAWNFIDPNNPHNIERNRSLQSAMTTAWTSNDNKKLENSILDLQTKVGPDALHICQGLAVGGATGKLSSRSIDFVKSAAAGSSPMMLATEGALSSGLRMGAESKVPTWNEYLNFNRRHGPVVQKSLQQFELETASKSATPKESDVKEVTGDKIQKAATTHLPKDSKNTHSQGNSDDDIDRGISLYFSERFGRFHH